jgi:hypothetical protein
VENFWKKIWKKSRGEKTWINDLEELKSVEKCQCGKKREKFPWKNITYLVVYVSQSISDCDVQSSMIYLICLEA